MAPTTLLLAVLFATSSPGKAVGTVFTPGLYRDQMGRSLYAATDIEDNGPVVNWLDPQTQQYGIMTTEPAGWRLEESVYEKRIKVEAPEGELGVSLYYTDTSRRGAVILIHGNEAQTREMGFLIPLFTLHGINVISYDQRGDGESTGNWQNDGPEQRAIDVEAIYDYFAKSSSVDAKRIGLWAFSNGGWTAPIVATKRPIAFMILVGAPAETLADNIYFEVHERMKHDGFTAQEISKGVQTARAYLEASFGTDSWEHAKELYAAAVNQKWFRELGLDPDEHFPPPKQEIDDTRRSNLYDPEPVLTHVTTPTLALFGARDRSVDISHAAPTLQADFKKAGMRDFTLHVYENAGHSLVVSSTGYEDQPSEPLQLVPDYSKVMIDWLQKRHFLAHYSH